MQRMKPGMGKSASTGGLSPGKRPGDTAAAMVMSKSSSSAGLVAARPAGKGGGKGGPPGSAAGMRPGGKGGGKGGGSGPNSKVASFGFEEEDAWDQPPPPPATREPPVGEASRLARKYHLDLFEVKYILRLFIEADDNGSGGLDKEEFTGVLRKLFEVPKNREVPKQLVKDAWEKLMQASSKAGGGMIEANPDAFCEWYTANMFSEMVREAENTSTMTLELARKHGTDVIAIDKIKKRFDEFDVDGGGTIDYDEFFQMLKFVLKAKSDEDIAPDRALRFWKEIDEDGSGECEFPEFVEWYVKYFGNTGDEEMDLSKGPVQKFYKSFNPMGKHI